MTPFICFQRRAFTLVEMMVSLSLLTLIALVMLTITNQTSRIWNYTSSRSEQFNNASLAFQTITQRLSQATLNTYWDYDTTTTGSTFTIKGYKRQSELAFLVDRTSVTVPTDASSPTAKPGPGLSVFFQAPLGFTDDPTNFGGLPALLNTWGYYLQFDKEDRPKLIDNLGVAAPPQRYRYRLLEMMEPSNYLEIYANPVSSSAPNRWFSDALKRTNPKVSHLLAENVIALVFLPQLGQADALKYEKTNGSNRALLSPRYKYDSTSTSNDGGSYPWYSQLPPVVQVTLVAIDEHSAKLIENGTSQPEPLNTLVTGLFTDSSAYAADLKKLQDALPDKNKVGRALNYRIFTSNISLRGARWSPN